MPHRPMLIAVYGQAGAPYHYIAILRHHGYSVTPIFAHEVRSGLLEAFDVFMVPGGGYRGMRGQILPLGRRGASAVASFVRNGGMYIGSCAGAYAAAQPAREFQAIFPAQQLMQLLTARVWNEDHDLWHGLESPGVGRISVRNDFPNHPVMRGMPPEFDIVHYNGPLFKSATSLLSVAGTTEAFTASEEFLGRAYSGVRMIDRAAADRSVSAAVTGNYGAGRVLLFGGHPEFGFSPVSMDDEQLPARLLLNAVQWQSEETSYSDRPLDVSLCSTRSGNSSGIERAIDTAVAALRTDITALTARALDRKWISPQHAMSTFGRSPGAIWESALAASLRLLDEIAELADNLPPSVLTFEPASHWSVDFGYSGVLPLLSRAHAMLRQAGEYWDINVSSSSCYPYAYIDKSPYHLVAGSYLAAIGRITAAALLCRSGLSGAEAA